VTGAGQARAVPIDARLRQIAEAGEPRAKGYRRHGDEAWAPGAEGPAETPAQRAERRRAEYARLREAEGLRIGEAARRIGMPVATAYKYERDRKARLAGAAGDAP
jgi:hypothetical protein